MNNRDIRRSDRANRVQIFGSEYADDFATLPKALELFTSLDQLSAKLSGARVGQLRLPTGKQTLIDALHLDFKDIARTSRSIALDEPGFASAAFRFPADYAEDTCTTHADSLLDLLEDNTAPVADGGDPPEQLAAKAALRAKFIAYALPADFVEDLRADRDAIDDSNSAKHGDNFEGVESTKAIDLVLGQIQSVVTRLDALMRNLYRDAPDKLRAWQSASHVERAPKKQKPDDDTTPPPVV